MPALLEAVVIRPVTANIDARGQQAQCDEVSAELARWMAGEAWWGEKGIEGPAARIVIDYSRDMLAHLFTLTEQGYVIASVGLRYRRPGS
jgi:hypothetical protein